MTRWLVGLGALLLWSTGAWGAIITAEQGTLLTCTADATGSDWLNVDGNNVLEVSYQTTGAVTLSLQQSIDQGTTWITVTDSAVAVTSTTSTWVHKSIMSPIGLYRGVCSSWGSGTGTIKYYSRRLK